jgi:predicted glycosyltransferase
MQLPNLLSGINRDKYNAKVLVKRHSCNLIISDNRYGLRHPDCYNVFITHQLTILLPKPVKLFQRIVNRLNHYLINHFDQCWVPDLAQPPRVAGVLSEPVRRLTNIHYVGLLSRLKNILPSKHNKTIDVLIILGGPEPQRTLLEQSIKVVLRNTGLTWHIAQGLPGFYNEPESNQSAYVDSSALSKLIARSKCIVCRSGYSSIMDLLHLNRSALLIPTPGQPEQEYLAHRMAYLQLFHYTNQRNVSSTTLNHYINVINQQDGPHHNMALESYKLDTVLKHMLKSINKQ